MQTLAPEINAGAASVLTQGPFTFSISTICLICLCAIATTSLSELLGWLITYRKESYKQTKSDIERLNKKLEKLKNTHVIQIQSKAHEKKIAAVQGQLKQISQGMTFDSMKSNIPTGILMIGAVYVIGTIFSGTVVGYLPFEPHWIIQKITHRNLPGEDYRECSYLFIYILFAFIWRSNLKKLLGFEAPKPAVSFFEPPKMKPE